MSSPLAIPSGRAATTPPHPQEETRDDVEKSLDNGSPSSSSCSSPSLLSHSCPVVVNSSSLHRQCERPYQHHGDPRAIPLSRANNNSNSNNSSSNHNNNNSLLSRGARASSLSSANAVPPRAPSIGSLPEPSHYLLDQPMPELVLPPPAESNLNNTEEDEFQDPSGVTRPRRRSSIVQFASSCPNTFDYLDSREYTHDFQRNTQLSEEELLSRSPSLAVMSAIRAGRTAASTPGAPRFVPSRSHTTTTIGAAAHSFSSGSTGVARNFAVPRSIPMAMPSVPTERNHHDHEQDVDYQMVECLSLDQRDEYEPRNHHHHHHHQQPGSERNSMDIEDGSSEIFDFEDH